MQKTYPLGALILAAALSAQTTFTSPRTLTTEGNDAWSFVFGYPISRWQQLDGTQRGSPIPNINRLELRRDGLAAGPYAGARTLTVELVMAHTDVATGSSLFATNYRTAESTTFTAKPVNLPDLTQLPSTVPAPWGIAFPFDNPFSYNGTQDMLWEIRADNSSLPGYNAYPLDCHINRTQNFVRGTATGSGCATANGPRWLSTTNSFTDTTGLALVYESVAAPSNAAIVLFLGTTNPDQAIGGLCARLHTNLLISVPLGNTNAGGYLLSAARRVTWNASFGNAIVYSQLAAADPTQTGLPIAVSNGLREQLPPALATTMNVRAYYTDSSLTTPVGQLWSAAIAARFTY
jgi:hypothetical protein